MAEPSVLSRKVTSSQLKSVSQALARLKITFSCGLGIFIPRANGLAIVTAEHPVTDGFAKLFGDHAFVLNSEIGNTAPRIQHIGLGEGIGRANFQARCAVATAIGLLALVHRQG